MIKLAQWAVSQADQIDLKDLIYPLFVVSGRRKRQRIPSMPGVYRFSSDLLVEEIGRLQILGVDKFLLFGVPFSKTWSGREAYQDKSVVANAIREVKKNLKNVILMTDVCLCAYTKHGHCGIINKGEKEINKELTLTALSEMALAHARAGADFVAPSAMAAGQVKAIRDKFDQSGFLHTKIMGYSAKFASNFYGPFRSVADSAPTFGDRTGYQLDYRRLQPALRKIEEDIKGKAGIVMVKPALGYLDVVREARNRFSQPLAVYNVSGEYSMVKVGARKGLWDEKKMIYEVLFSLKRAGADLIITYHAKDVARWQKKR